MQLPQHVALVLEPADYPWDASNERLHPPSKELEPLEVTLSAGFVIRLFIEKACRFQLHILSSVVVANFAVNLCRDEQLVLP